MPPTVGSTVGNVNLRNKDNLRSIHTRTPKYQKSFLPNVVNIWNNLDTQIVESDSISAFKRKVSVTERCQELYFYGTRNLALIHSQMRWECSNLKHIYFCYTYKKTHHVHVVTD